MNYTIQLLSCQQLYGIIHKILKKPAPVIPMQAFDFNPLQHLRSSLLRNTSVRTDIQSGTVIPK